MGEINTEKLLDMDYFSLNENADTSTVSSFLREYNEIGGLRINYYRQQDPDMGLDPVFLEKGDKKWCRPIPMKAVFEYLQEVIENQKYGIQILDELNLIIEKTYFQEMIRHEPKIGDLIHVVHVNLMFEIVNIVDTDANFWGKKLTWKFTGKIWQNAHEDEEIENDMIEPGWKSDEQLGGATDADGYPVDDSGAAVDQDGNPIPGTGNDGGKTKGINMDIEEESEQIHVYDSTDHPFGNF